MPKVVSSNLGCDPVVRVVSSHLTVILDIHVSAKPETQMRAHLAAVITEFPGVRLKVLPHFKLLILKGNSYFNVHKKLILDQMDHPVAVCTSTVSKKRKIV